MLSNIVNLASILDIFILSLLIYTILLFLRLTKSYLVFLGLAITLALYILAKVANLQLTYLAMQYFVSASVVLFGIIFQNELRKYLELIGLIGSRQFKTNKPDGKLPIVTEVVQACVKMAQTKTGALIVLGGNDNLDAVIEGGVVLDGVISEEILLSIFDAHSLGHDGAVIITNNRIAKLGAHLPLSTNFKLLGKHGTRHSAALGLSENSDAFCIVVSEEKGTISICKDSKFKTLAEFTDLEKELNKYINAKFVPDRENPLVHAIKHNFSLKVGALAFALVAWILSNY